MAEYFKEQFQYEELKVVSSKYGQIISQCITAFESYHSLLDEFGSPDDIIDYKMILQKLDICSHSIEVLLELDVDETCEMTLLKLKYHLEYFCGVILKKQHNNYSKTQNNGRIESKQSSSVEKTIVHPRAQSLNDVMGLWEAKKILRTAIILPKLQPQLFKGRKVCNRILLFGPPGTGKTLLVHALAAEINAKLHSISASDVLSPLVGESEKMIKSLFQYAGETNDDRIIFIDEIDAFCRKRLATEQEHSRRLITEIMCQMSNIEECSNIYVIGATNCPWDLDSAILRRFQKHIFMSLPGKVERLQLLKFFVGNTYMSLPDTRIWDELLDITNGFSSSDIATLVENAKDIPINELMETKLWKKTIDDSYEPANEDDDELNIFWKNFDELPNNSVRARPLRISDLLSAVEKYTPSVTIKDMENFEAFNKKK